MKEEKRRRRVWFIAGAAVVLLIVWFLVASKLHADANVDLRQRDADIGGILQEIIPEAREEVNSAFLREVRLNPSFAPFMAKHGDGGFSAPDGFVSDVRSSHGRNLAGYLDFTTAEVVWEIRMSTPSPVTDFSKLPIRSSHRRVDVRIRCFRPWGVVPSESRIEIVDSGAAQNGVLLTRLCAALEERGLEYQLSRPAGTAPAGKETPAETD